MPEPHLRAADTDRTAVATVLGEHMAAGRLTVAEYEERLGRAYAAKTYGELAELTADLPAPERSPVPVPEAAVASRGRWEWMRDEDWRAWASTSLIVLAIWAITSLATWELLYFWPVWVIGPWGAVLLAGRLTGDREDDEDQDDDEPRRLG
ncbi:UNVERIFIED_ORG: DUF1707 domain-containing protein [Bacillus sp. AZ43]